MPFSSARGKLGVDILKFLVWCFIDFWPIFVYRRSYRWHFCMFVQGQHVDTVNVVDLTLFSILPSFDPLSVGRTKRSPRTLLHLRPRVAHWPFYFCHLTHFIIWPLTFDLLTVGQTKRSQWILLHVCSTPTHWSFNFCHLTHFVIWPSLTFDPLSVGRTKRSPWTLMHVCPTPTHWHCYFCHLMLFVIWPRLWPLWPQMTSDWPVVDNFCRE